MKDRIRMLTSTFMDQLDGIGWFEEMPDSERERVATAAAKILTIEPDNVWYALAVTSFDIECVEGSGPMSPCSYHSILTQLAQDSFGFFNPTEISDAINEMTSIARISFVADGETYRCTFRFDENWFKPALLEAVNAAIARKGFRSQFHLLPPAEHMVSLTLVSPDAYERAIDLGLIKAPEKVCDL